MKKISFSLLFLAAVHFGANAQNTFPATGRVGIFTTAPAASLQVRGGARMGTLTNYTNIDSATGSLSFLGTANYLVQNNQFAFRAATAANIGLLFNQTNTRIEFRNSAGTSVFNVGVGPSGNNVGIGITQPQHQLAVGTQTVDGQSVAIRGYSNAPLNWKGGAAFGYNQASVIMGQLDSVATIGGHNADLSAWANLAINPVGGNVGIGTAKPVAKLDIVGNIKIADGTQGAGKILTSDANGLASWSASAVSPFTISDNDIYNNNTGNIGIGTTTPAAKLDVNGDALINGITIGRGAGNSDVNIAVGKFALYSNTTGGNNTAFGTQALFTNTAGYLNAAMGYNALISNTTGNFNTAIGNFALKSNTTGSYNTGIGLQALYSNTTGFYNTAIGLSALFSNTTGSSNTTIGTYSDVATPSLTMATAIGYGATVDAPYKVRIGNTSISSIGGQVGWTTFSDGRYKKNIKEDVKGLVFINSLKPITYTVDINGLDTYFDKNRKHDSAYDKMQKERKPAADEASKIVYNGFIAQDVEAAAKKLNYDFSGVDKPKSKDGLYGLRYSDFVVPLVKAVQELSKQNDDLKSENEAQQKINADLQKQIDDLKALITKGNVTGQSESLNIEAVAESNAAFLKQNTPNPYSVSTVIHFSLPKQYANAQIIITDMTGKTIKQANVSGSNSLTVAAGSLASGSYKYSLVVDGKMMGSKTMVITK